MYKNVYDLSAEEFAELKESYFCQMQDTDPDVLGGIENWWEIDDSVIYEHYAGTSFVEEDFFCNMD